MLRPMLALLAVVLAVAPAGRLTAEQQPPPSPGGRGPNPMTGLVGLVELPTTGPDAPRFEVASVKRNPRGGGNPAAGRTMPGGQIRTTNATLRMLIRTAYRLTLADQIVDGPSWIDSYGFDVDARPAKPVTLVESWYMLRTLLAERFQLVARKESREGPVYALVPARPDGVLGPQIKRPAGECVMSAPALARTAGGADDAKTPEPGAVGAWPPPGRPGRHCGLGPDGDTLKAGSVTMTTLVTFLTPLLDRPVIDRTGWAGSFDFDLRYDSAASASAAFLGRGRGAAVSPDTPLDPGAPSIFTALQEQLGLRLEAQRGSVSVLAVLRAELPTEN